MARRLLAPALVLAAVALNLWAPGEAARYALVAAVPVAAIAALASFGELVDRPGVGRLRVETALAALLLVSVVAASAAR